MTACAGAGTGVGSEACSDSAVGRAFEATDASTGAGSGSLVVSWGGSGCRLSVFSFSDGGVASNFSSRSATVASGALTAGDWGGAGVPPDRFSLRPHGGTQGETGGKYCGDGDSIFHFVSSSLDVK